jgi:hypothetical protein
MVMYTQYVPFGIDARRRWCRSREGVEPPATGLLATRVPSKPRFVVT